MSARIYSRAQIEKAAQALYDRGPGGANLWLPVWKAKQRGWREAHNPITVVEFIIKALNEATAGGTLVEMVKRHGSAISDSRQLLEQLEEYGVIPSGKDSAGVLSTLDDLKRMEEAGWQFVPPQQVADDDELEEVAA